MGTKALSVSEISDIIKLCRSEGVEKFQLSDLSITFRTPKEYADQPSKASDHTEVSTNTTPVVSEVASKSEKQEMQFMNEEAIEDAEEAQVMIDDPAGFERLQIARHIERNRQLSLEAQRNKVDTNEAAHA